MPKVKKNTRKISKGNRNVKTYKSLETNNPLKKLDISLFINLAIAILSYLSVTAKTQGSSSENRPVINFCVNIPEILNQFLHLY